MIYDDPLWRYLVEEFDENLDPPYCRKEGEAYHPNYDHNFDGEVLTITNKQTGQKFEVREKLIE